MALEITGIKRVFTFKKGTATITLDDPNPSDSPENGDGILFQYLSRTDNRHDTRSHHEGRRGGL